MLTKCKKGFKQKKGKCVRNNPKKRISHRKESYNPFRMWGAWLGLIIVFIYLYSLQLDFIIGIEKKQLIIQLLVTIGYSIIGFLVGWGIHSLIRKVRN